MANQKTGQIQDPFTATSANAQWTVTQLGSATFSFTAQNASVVFPGTTSSSTDGDLTFANGQILDLTGSFVRLKVTSVAGASATHTDCVLRIRQNSSNYVTIFYEAGTLFFSKVVAGSQTNITSVAYNASTHLWWQIRESNGITFWETSSDGINFTTQTAQADPVTLSSVDILIGGLCFGVDTSPSNFTFKYLNYPLYGTSTSTSSTSISSTSSSISSTSTSSTSSSSSTSSTSNSTSISSTSTSISITTISTSSTSSSISSTSTSSTSSSTSISSTSSSISSTSQSSTSISSTSSSTSISSTSTSFSSTSSSISSTSSSVSSTSFSSTSSSSSTSTTTLPPPYLDYTYQDVNPLAGTNADLINNFTATQYSNASVDDGDYAIISGSQYLIGNFEITGANNTSNINVVWKGRSTVAPSISPMYLQIFNNNKTNPTIVYLTATGANTWAVPNDFTPLNNIVECIGGGGGGATGGSAGDAGGGGGYSKIYNFGASPGSSVNYNVGAGGAGAPAGANGAGSNGGDTFINAVTYAAAAVAAKGGTGGANTSSVFGQGGRADLGIGTTCYSGGNGGNSSGIGAGVSGGGGAGGPHGNGAAGGNEPGSGGNAGSGGGGGGGGFPGQLGGATTGGNGGNNYAGTGGGPGSSSTGSPGTGGTAGGGGGGGATNAGQTASSAGGAGGIGAEWDGTHGSGGGGGGAGSTFNAAVTASNGGGGGKYGGGGGAGGDNDVSGDAGKGGDGAQGIIVITYYPAWETLAVNNTAPADTDFTIKASQTTNLSNYYGTNLRASCRVYQKVI